MTIPITPSIDIRITRPGYSLGYLAYATALDNKGGAVVFRHGGKRNSTGKISVALLPDKSEALPRFSDLDGIVSFVKLVGSQVRTIFGEDLPWVQRRIGLNTRVMFYSWLKDPDITMQLANCKSRLEREHLTTMLNDAGIPEEWF